MTNHDEKHNAPAAPPDLIVGIDFGMTGTAVAFAAPVDPNISVLREWPGAAIAQDKVPSVIAYQNDQPSSWGFNVNLDEPPKDPGIKTFFKGVFDKGDLEEVNRATLGSGTTEEVERWLTDYLQQLYEHIKESLKSRLPAAKEWDMAKIKYLFSYPTTWKLDTVQRYENVIRQAGFGPSVELPASSHEVYVALDEAQAAAAYFFAESKLPDVGDHLLIADIGGGTSDVCIFEVEKYEDTTPKLKLKTNDQGRNAGSTKIDEGFERFLLDRLPFLQNQHPNGTSDDTDEAKFEIQAWKMIQDDAFLAEKCRYGAKPKSITKLHFWVPVPNFEGNVHNSNVEVEKGQIKVDKGQLFKPLFEEQCRIIWEQFEAQIKKAFPASHPDNNEKKVRVVIAGGMGRSEYVQSYLKKEFQSKYGIVPSFTIAKEPQLAVCKGLVHHELKQINGGGIFRYSVQSWYGIDKDSASQSSVEWFLKKGEIVSLPESRSIDYHVDVDGEGKIKSDLVKTTEDIKLKWLSKRSTKLEKEPDLVASLTDKLPPKELKRSRGLGLQKSRREVKFKILLGHHAMRFEITQGKRVVGAPVYISEHWYSRPLEGEGKSPGSPRTPGWWRLKGKNIDWDRIIALTAVAVGVTAAVAAVLSLTGDQEQRAAENKKKEDKEAKQGEDNEAKDRRPQEE